jgi:hypothetical protein
LVAAARTRDLVALIHPCSYRSRPAARDDFLRLLDLAEQNGVEWKIWSR